MKRYLIIALLMCSSLLSFSMNNNNDDDITIVGPTNNENTLLLTTTRVKNESILTPQSKWMNGLTPQSKFYEHLQRTMRRGGQCCHSCCTHLTDIACICCLPEDGTLLARLCPQATPDQREQNVRYCLMGSVSTNLIWALCLLS